MGRVTEILAVLDELKPLIQGHGGDLEFLGFEDGIVTIRLVGACTTCPFSLMTAHMGVEQRLKERCPEVRSVKLEL